MQDPDLLPDKIFESEGGDTHDFHIAPVSKGLVSGVLGAFALIALSATPVTAHSLKFDQDVTPDAIFGSGNANGGFTVHRRKGVEIGLRVKQRFDPANVFNSNGDGTYSFETGVGTGSFPRPV